MLSISNLVVEKEIKNSFSIHFWDKEYVQPATYRLIYNRILFIYAGRGEVTIDDHTFGISSPMLLLIGKGQLIDFKAGAHFKGYELNFGDCFWERTPSSVNNCKAVLFNDPSRNQVIPLAEEDHVQLTAVFSVLNDEFEKEEYINKLDVMAAYLKIIMIKIANVNQALNKGFNPHENQLYVRFLELISQNYKISREVGDYARLLRISARKLTDLSKRCSDKGAKELINGQIISEAKRSLQFSSRPIKEIAFDLNFTTPDQFSHFFKKNAKVSPHDYRALFLNMGTSPVQ